MAKINFNAKYTKQYNKEMQQQLIEQTIQITPATMNQVLLKIIHSLSQKQLSDKVLSNIVKSLFYGLWNFDKMINQHNLSTQISQILNKIPKKNAFSFLHSILQYLKEKWNLIDHHRINKFMQLAKYLVKQGFKVSHKKTDQVLLDTVFKNVQQRSGIADHITQIYFDTACEVFLTKISPEIQYNSILPFQKLQIFEKLLKCAKSLEYFRIHIMQKIYEKYKQHIIQIQLPNGQQKILQKIQSFNAHILQLAKQEEDDLVRKNLYTLIGFMKSDQTLLNLYMQQRKQKIMMEREKKKKKISKHKKQMIKEAKQKRKQKNKQNKKSKIISRPKFEFKARQQMQKMID